ncbi:NACHT domain-containing protein [Paludibaculum fermentans]|uniref:NACHT domain-containing protein n=1 Tax=Paludibaculum fermentans TaxID=1473598 RepID=UPI003EBFE979
MFKDEADLRQCLRKLLTKMGREEVRITHGTLEKGKDIVFYARGGMNERAPYACVVKKDRITGSVSARTSAKAVLQQAEQAFDEPYTNPSNGQREQIKGVYIISPYDTPVSASESVGDRLARQGRTIEFVCGTRLMELFAEHWKDFLLFDSGVLASYLSAMRAGLSKDTALIDVILGRNLPAELPGSFQQMYVPQSFSAEVRCCSLDDTLRQDLSLPSGLIRLADIRAIEQRVRKLLRVVDYLEACPGIALRTETGGSTKVALASYIDALHHDWSTACKAAAAAALKDFETLTAEDRKRSASAENRRREPPRAAPKLPTERTIATTVELSLAAKSWLSRAEEVKALIVQALEEDCLRIRTDWRAKSDLEWLFSSEFRAHCRLLDLEDTVPDSVRRDQTAVKHRLSFGADFLDGAPRLVLLTGPAGFGKTSFCRWQSLACAESMLDGTGRVLPVYVPLSRFAYGAPANADEAFFQAPELRQLLHSSKHDTTIRLYLDGLDEMPDHGRQQQIVNFARTAVDRLPNLQVIFTARDHVVGPWLNDVVRLSVNELDSSQQRSLVCKWLESGEATDRFFEQLSHYPTLQPLMGIPLLAMLIGAVYKRQQCLPETRTRLYTLFVELRCGGWDAIKGVHRGGKFGQHDKRTVLVRLAGMNHLARRRDAAFDQFRGAIRCSLAGLEEFWDELLDELIQDGLVVSTGGGIRFSHLSFQEFLASEHLNEPTGERLKVPLKEFLQGDDWWREVIAFYITRFGTPSDTEGWLVRRAREVSKTSNALWVHRGALDERIGWLRSCLREAFPTFRSQYPEDGIIEQIALHRSKTGTHISRSRRRLSGLNLNEDG